MLKALKHTKIKPDLNVNLKGNFNDIDYHTGTFNCISIFYQTISHGQFEYFYSFTFYNQQILSYHFSISKVDRIDIEVESIP